MQHVSSFAVIGGGPSWLPAWSPLLVQAFFAILTIELLRRRALRLTSSLRDPRLFSDALGPIIIVIPMLFTVGRVPADVRGAGGWLAVAGPVTCGLFGLAMAMLSGGSARWADPSGHDDARRGGLPAGAIAAWTGAGLLLLLLAAAHDLSLWVGQFALAAGAVLLWMNTPELSAAARPRQDDAESGPQRSEPDSEPAAHGAITASLLASIGHGFAAILVPLEYASVSGALSVVTAAMALAATVRLAGPLHAMKLGGWAATYGVLMTPGLIALLQMTPRALEIIREGSADRLNRVAYGFGGYTIEGLAMLLLAATFLAQRWIASASARRGLGVTLLALAAALAAARLAGW